jgi:iron(III) transport system permease protein
LLQSALEVMFGAQRLPDMYGLLGATAVLTLLIYPYLFLTVRGSIANLDSATEEASRSLGHGAWSTFFRVTLPQLKPSITAGSLLVALYTLSEVCAVALLRYNTFTFTIYQQYEGSIDRSIAALLSFVLVIMAVAILLSENYTRGRGRYYRLGAGAARSPYVVQLGRWKWAVLGAMGTVLTLALVLPVGVLMFWLIRGLGAGEPLLLLWSATRNSLLASGAAAVVTATMAIAMAVLLVRYPSKLNRVLEPISFTGYALPGVVVALALVFFGVKYARPLYQTHWLLIFAYAVLFFPVALGSVRSALLQVSPRLEDAARCLGHNPLRVMTRVTLPLMRSGVLMGAALVFLLTMKELPATLILGPLGFQTLATSVWSASIEAFFARAAAPALMIILTSSIPMTLLVLREKRTLH